jgi:hypothetical protein
MCNLILFVFWESTWFVANIKNASIGPNLSIVLITLAQTLKLKLTAKVLLKKVSNLLNNQRIINLLDPFQ